MLESKKMIDSKISLCIVYVKNLLYFNYGFNILIMVNIRMKKRVSTFIVKAEMETERKLYCMYNFIIIWWRIHSWISLVVIMRGFMYP